MCAKLSIVVPVYGVEEYLDRAVESMLNQTLKDLEIILVDDGSPDRCGSMCDEYAAKYPNISVVHKKNGGLSDARNAGMAVAHGEYIGFVDPDDYIVPEMFEKLYSSAVANDADFVGCGHRIQRDNGVFENVKSNLPTGVYGRETIVRQLAAHLFGDEKVLYPRDTSGYAWMNIYRGDIIRKNSLKFCSERKYYHEDDVFFLDFMFYAQKAAFVDAPLYIYCVREGSLIRCYRKNMWEMNKALLGKFRDFAEKYGIEDDYERLIPSLKIDYSLSSVLNECKTGCPNSLRESIGVIRTVCSDPITREVFASGEQRKCYRHEKICLILMKRRLARTICISYRLYYRLVQWKDNLKSAKAKKKA